MVREVATAVGFLTRFPTFSQERVDLLGASVLWFPLIGGFFRDNRGDWVWVRGLGWAREGSVWIDGGRAFNFDERGFA